MGKRKKEDDSFLKKKTEEKQNSANIMISLDGKRRVLPVNLELQGK